jgi:hypothetical protein
MLTESFNHARRCVLGRLPVSSRHGRSGLESDFGESWRIGLHAASTPKIQMAFVERY